MPKQRLEAMSQSPITTKPKLKRVTGIWFCVTRDHSGSGETPKLAYSRWADALVRDLAYLWN